MTTTLIARATIEIRTDSESVWKALTTPELIKQYFFGTETECDWKIGSPFFFRGEWQGKKYEDKGTILDIQPGKLIKYNYWSSMSGTQDIPENYSTVTYEVLQNGIITKLTILQDGIKTEESKKHSEQNWGSVLEGLKKMLEVKS